MGKNKKLDRVLNKVYKREREYKSGWDDLEIV
jgi:hypothetical protein